MAGCSNKYGFIGDTVDIAKGTYTNSIGAGELSAAWTDADFKAGERAWSSSIWYSPM